MIQLFEPFAEKYIERLKQINKNYLVSQTYSGEKDPVFKSKEVVLMLTDYEDAGLATVHKAAVKYNKYAAIIDLRNEQHVKKLKEMLNINSPYLLYWAMIKDREILKKRISLRYRDHMHRYINKNTRWHISRDEKIIPKSQLIFGELYIILKRRNEELRIKFADLEKA